MRLLLEKKYHQQVQSSGTTFAIGLAVLKSFSEETDESMDKNLLIKRFTLQIENLKIPTSNPDDTKSSDEEDNDTEETLDDWNFRESILKCLYAKDVKYPANFKWQIQIRSSKSEIKTMNTHEDLFKLFAWRQCEQEETTSCTTSHSISKKSSFNQISIRPIKTMNHLNKEHKLKVQLFVEEPMSNEARLSTVSKSIDHNNSYFNTKMTKFKKYRPSLNKTLNSSNSNADDDD
jgi:hypothetical protein